MADVFISYHRSEGTSALVRRIDNELKDMNISCWYDAKHPISGSFIESIIANIKSCKVFLLIWDKGANSSQYVYNEVHTSFPLYRKQITPVPFKVGRFELDTGLKFYLAPFNILDGGDSPENAYIKDVIIEIGNILGKKVPPKIISRGNCGADVSYTLDENGILTIVGSGFMWDWKLGNTPWWSERRRIVVAHIQYGVNSIGANAFSDCTSLTEVNIPTSVFKIESAAFLDCKSLGSVEIPEKMRSIQELAFAGCTNLRDVILPYADVDFGIGVFRNCEHLRILRIQ
ncbi:MAG: leucine-rich repeat protein [Oscillospiraceae bacterium]|nr:leucine-rich repeat protein [Oscillospiraceae bacterium]